MRQLLAVAVGGPAAGAEFPVDVIGDHWPRYVGIRGGNYVADGTAERDRPVYLHWPVDSDAPVERYPS